MNVHKKLFTIELENKKLSKNTIISYEKDLTDFFVYLNEIKIDDFKYVNHQHILDFNEHLKCNGKRISTINRKITSIKIFFKFLLKNNVIEDDPTNKIFRYKIHREIPEYISREELNQIIDFINLDSFIGQRDRIIINILYETGIKISELINIQLSDYSYNSSNLFVGKRKILLTKTINKLLNNYFINIRPFFNVGIKNSLFLNYKGYKISRQGVWKNIKKYATKANANLKISPHILRNSYAINRLSNGIDIFEVKNEMGYRNITSTKYYNHCINEEV